MPADTYLGNAIHYPAQSKVGENCLIGTKAMVPIDGEIREGVGILGSPPFEIPRSVLRDQKFDHFKEPSVLKKRLKMKLISNLWTVALYIFRNITGAFFVAAITWEAWQIFGQQSLSIADKATILTLLGVVTMMFTLFYHLLFENIATKFNRMKPLYCSLYDKVFWDHERFWKMSITVVVGVFSGTPMQAFFLRLRGMKVGKMFFDDGAGFPEPKLVRVGDHCTFNSASTIQCHSLEDGTFKSDFVNVGDGVTAGVNSFIHYGTTIEEGTHVLADSFVMKGSITAAGSTWGGNPARDSSADGFDAMELVQAEPANPATASAESEALHTTAPAS